MTDGMDDDVGDEVRKAFIAEQWDLVRAIKPILRGHAPEIQGAVLADLAAFWLAGHPSIMRPGVMKFHVEMITTLLPINEALLFDGHRHPSDEVQSEAEEAP
jgi:hypothetical protein